MSSAFILVVEDEPTIARAIVRRLTAEGYLTEVVCDGLEAVAKAKTGQPDLIVLDVMLPGIDGLEVCRQVQADMPVPILMLTARDDEADKLIGLGVGADDYMTKPFSMRELLARIRALLRRVERAKELAQLGSTEEPIVIAGLVIDRQTRRVSRAGVEVHLTPTEFDLLVFLMSSPGTVLTREKILDEVWGWAEPSNTRTIDSHIKGLRRKLGARLFRTVHGVGYAFEPNEND
jgi:DNA-binding response OmpR family regulator